MKIYYGIIIPEYILYQAIAKYKYGTKDLPLFTDNLRKEKVLFFDYGDPMYSLYKNEFEFGLITKFLRVFGKNTELRYLERENFPHLPVFLGYSRLIDSSNLFYVEDLDKIGKDEKEEINQMLASLQLDQFPIKLMIHLYPDSDDLCAPSDYGNYIKNKL